MSTTLCTMPSAGATRSRCHPRHHALLAPLLLALLTGCATLAPDADDAALDGATRQHLGASVSVQRSPADSDAAAQQVAQLLAAPLGRDAAVQVALLNHRGLQAQLAQLGVSDAERVMASRLPNPGFSFGRMRSGDEVELERGLHLNLARWLMAPQIAALEDRRHAQQRAELTQAVLALGFDTQAAWVQAVAAQQSTAYLRQVMQAAEASAELARRMLAAGNFNKLQRAREQAFYADAALALARAEQQQRMARERLARQLGLWGEQLAFRLPERLPELPATLVDTPALEQAAMASRLDVAAAKLAAAQTAERLGLTRTTRFINVLELGAVRNSSDATTTRGWEISVELPLFDWGDARVARAEALYRQALHQTAAVAINARSEVREAYAGWRSAHAIARHHLDEVVPLRRQIADENLLRYNGMLIGVFELLADARSQITSVDAALQAQRDFWLAQVQLDRVQLLPAGAAAAMAGPAAAAPDTGAAGH